MKRIMLVVALAVLILPLAVAGESSSVVEKLMKDSATTDLGKKTSRKKPSVSDIPALQDIKGDIEGRAEANRALREYYESGSQGEDSRVRMKREAKAKRQRIRERQKKSQPPEPSR